MKIIPAILTSALITVTSFGSALAYPSISHTQLNKVVYRTVSEQWVNTQSANVIVGINATLDKQGLAVARKNIMQNLQTIAKGQWHITAFNRSQDSSGLERLTVQAEARLDQNQLAGLRSKAKSITKPGTTYRINAINFTPSLAEVEKTRQALRDTLYQQANNELTRLNTVYPKQHFTLYRLNFIPGAGLKRRQAARSMLKTTSYAAMPAAEQAIQVSNKLRMSALAIFAAQRGNVEKQQ